MVLIISILVILGISFKNQSFNPSLFHPSHKSCMPTLGILLFQFGRSRYEHDKAYSVTHLDDDDIDAMKAQYGKISGELIPQFPNIS